MFPGRELTKLMILCPDSLPNFFPLSSGCQDSNVSSFLDVLVRVVNDFLEDYAMDMLKLDAMHGKYMMPNEKKHVLCYPSSRKKSSIEDNLGP